ncbi:MAG: hypothetical protein CVU56_20500 [Deltaproteobacteria bacterium HGW-Deltaproteobacteria-14]|nr:MAG: hypothetical protein CVU56_20500 [Deltaproteobacteria bacterium HGW-Deltaproteobacteria-14]
MAAALLLLVGAPSLARAGDDDKSGTLTVWTVTAEGKAIGTESLRVVHSDSGAFFASGTQKLKAGKAKTELQSHVQRAADGTLMKYRRVEAKRKGKGLFVFLREGGARIVGVNSDAKQADLPGILSQHIWDPALWHDLALVPARLGADSPVTLKYFDVEARTSGTATFTRGATTQVTDAKGGLVTVTVWDISGAPGTARALYVDGKRRLVGVRGQDRAMLLKDWTWEDGTKASGGDDDEAKPAGGGDDDDEGGEPEVGP